MATSPVQSQDPEIAQLLAEQKTGIGGSEIFHLYNEREFGKGCIRFLGYKKLGYEEDSPEDSEKKQGIFRRGRKMEPIIAEEYEIKTGRSVRRQGVRRDKERGWPIVHMDRQVLAGTGIGEWRTEKTGSLEIKSFGEWAFRQMIKDKAIRKATLLQGLHTMLVTGYDYCGFAGMNVADFDLRPFDIPRDEEMIDDIKKRGDEFWNLKEKAGEKGDNPFPQLEDADDIRCLTCTYAETCRGKEADLEMRRVMDGKKELVQITSPTLVENLRDREAVKAEIKADTAIVDNIDAAIKGELGEVTAAKVLEYGKVYFQGRATTYFDKKAYLAAYEALSSDAHAFARAAAENSDVVIYNPSKLFPLAVEMAKFVVSVDPDVLTRKGTSERFITVYPDKK